MARSYARPDFYAEVESRAVAWMRPGSGDPSDLGDVALSPDGGTVAGIATFADAVDRPAVHRLCLIDTASGALEILSASPRSDRAPRWSPDGRSIAFISDRDAPFDFQCIVIDVADRSEHVVRIPHHWIEYALWSPDGTRLLLGAAGLAAETAGVAGAVKADLGSDASPAWAPSIDDGPAADEWRSLWLYELAAGTLRRIGPAGVNPWEAAWCGDDAVVMVASDDPSESAWYRADARFLDLADGSIRILHRPRDQVSWISASPDGKRIALVDALCSDRGIAAGELWIGMPDGGFGLVDTAGTDVTMTGWRDAKRLVHAGLRGVETVIAERDVVDETQRILWESPDRSFGTMFMPTTTVAPAGLAIVAEGCFAPPALLVIGDEGARTIWKIDIAAEDVPPGRMEPFRWYAKDGLEIEGLLIRPPGDGPHPLIVEVHGGPVWAWRPRFIGRRFGAAALLADGYALFQPNVRGSIGRGRAFVAHVFGDMGGADTDDVFTGIDALAAAAIADPARIGVTGVSYGGYMAAWLPMLSNRFAAAVPISPVTDWVSERLTSYIPLFCDMFLGDAHDDLAGRYFSRSPVLFAGKTRTPMLVVAGALDNITPPGQAIELHRALRLAGCESVLALYPQEGHGISRNPATIDFGARMLEWFRRHMPVRVTA